MSDQVQADGVIAEMPGVGRVVLCGNNVPADGSRGYAKGCVFIKINAASTSTLYKNHGTLASSTFVEVGVLDPLAVTSLTVSGTATIDTLTVSGTATIDTLAVSGTATIDTLAVSTTGSIPTLTVLAGLTLGDGIDVTIDSSTGSKIGQATSRIGFFGVTPVPRPASILTPGTGSFADPPTQGNLQDYAAAVDAAFAEVIGALQDLGLVGT